MKMRREEDEQNAPAALPHWSTSGSAVMLHAPEVQMLQVVVVHWVTFVV